MLKKISRIIDMVILVLLIAAISAYPNTTYAYDSGTSTIHIKIDFVSNILFDKYDVDLFLDNQKIRTLPHGTDYEGDISSHTGFHTLSFSNTKKPSIQWAGSFSASEETTISAIIITHGKEIEVKEFTYFDDAAYKAEQERQRAREEEQKRKKSFDNSIWKLKNLSNVDDPEVAQFAEKYKDQIIELEGNIAAVLSVEGASKALFRLGDYKTFNDKGADFIIDIPPDFSDSGAGIEQNNVTFRGSVKGYDEDSNRIIMETKDLSLREASKIQSPDTGSPQIIKAVQEALNTAGYDCGKPDGIAGKKTYAAIKAYKSANGLSGDTNLDLALLAMLRISQPKEETKTDTSTSSSKPQTDTVQRQLPVESYVLNKNTGKFHYPYCSSVNRMKESNKVYFTGTRQEVINRGYVPCAKCHP